MRKSDPRSTALKSAPPDGTATRIGGWAPERCHGAGEAPFTARPEPLVSAPVSAPVAPRQAPQAARQAPRPASGWADGWARRNASRAMHASNTLIVAGNGARSTAKRFALKICGTRQTSAIETSSP